MTDQSDKEGVIMEKIRYKNKTLYVKGNTDLLNKPSVAIVGTRDPSKKAYRVTERLGIRLAEEDINVVSGYAKGIDTAAHYGALSAGGTTTVVLPTGISKLSVKKELYPYWSLDKICAVSEFPVNAGFTRAQALQRNETICEMSSSVIIPQISTLKSGTASTYRHALRLGKPVYVIDASDLEPGLFCANNGMADVNHVRLQTIADHGVHLFLY